MVSDEIGQIAHQLANQAVMITFIVVGCGLAAAAFVPSSTPSTFRAPARCSTNIFKGPPVGKYSTMGQPSRCRIVAEETSQSLGEEQLLAIFEEFDTSGDGFIDVGELQAALGKAGKDVSLEEAGGILKRVDANNDGQISFDEFTYVFARVQLLPSSTAEISPVGFYEACQEVF